MSKSNMLLNPTEISEKEIEKIRSIDHIKSEGRWYLIKQVFAQELERERKDRNALLKILIEILSHWPSQQVLESLEPKDDGATTRLAPIFTTPYTAQLRRWRELVNTFDLP